MLVWPRPLSSSDLSACLRALCQFFGAPWSGTDDEASEVKKGETPSATTPRVPSSAAAAAVDLVSMLINQQPSLQDDLRLHLSALYDTPLVQTTLPSLPSFPADEAKGSVPSLPRAHSVTIPESGTTPVLSRAPSAALGGVDSDKGLIWRDVSYVGNNAVLVFSARSPSVVPITPAPLCHPATLSHLCTPTPYRAPSSVRVMSMEPSCVMLLPTSLTSHNWPQYGPIRPGSMPRDLGRLVLTDGLLCRWMGAVLGCVQPVTASNRTSHKSDWLFRWMGAVLGQAVFNP